jgi:hypothetical protein
VLELSLQPTIHDLEPGNRWLAILQGKRQRIRMMELTSYGLTGLATVLIIAFCAAFNDEFLSIRKKRFALARGIRALKTIECANKN